MNRPSRRRPAPGIGTLAMRHAGGRGRNPPRWPRPKEGIGTLAMRHAGGVRA